MQVLFLPGWYPNRTHATLGNFVQRHAQAVATLHDVTVVHAVKDAAARGLEVETMVQGRLTEHLLYMPGGAWGRLRATLSRIAHLQRTGHRFDVMHGNILHATAPQLWLAHRRWRLPFLVSENWTGYHLGSVGQLPMATRAAMHLAAKSAALLCPVSGQLAVAMRRHGFNTPHRVIPNVVDTDLFRPAENGRSHSGTCFLHVSTLVDAHKNITGLLQAFAEARRQVPSIRLHILGDGDSTPHEATAAALGLGADSIRFSGPAEPAAIARHMQESDAFVLPSNHENLPCVMLEAFATGLPVLATAVGGIPEHLAPERGALIARGDMAALRNEMVSLANGSRTFNHAAIREYAVDRFSRPVVAAAFDSAYRHILGHA